VHGREKLTLRILGPEEREHTVGQPAGEIIDAEDAKVRIAEREAIDRRHVRVPTGNEYAQQLGEERLRVPHVLQYLRAMNELHGTVDQREPFPIAAYDADDYARTGRRIGREPGDSLATTVRIELDGDDESATRDVGAGPQRVPAASEI
jgi:hypothetical protein